MAEETRSEIGKENVRIMFHLDPGNEQGIKTETVWAQPIGPGTFRIANSPFYVFGVSSEDVVSARETAGRLVFQEVISKGGHSTYRVFLHDGRTIHSPEFKKLWTPISELGATFENANDHFVAVDIPKGRDIHAIYELLDQGEQDEVWSFEEGNYES